MNGNFFSNLIDGINDVANKVFEAILVLLPTSPFTNIKQYLPSGFRDFLGYLNYYVPISTLLVIASAWITCIATYYAYQLILRSVQAVQ